MKIRRFGSGLLWVAFCAVAGWGLAFLPGVITPALAEAGNGAGGISGGFFAGFAPLAGLPGIPSAAIPANVLQHGSGLCEAAVASASAGQHLPAGLLDAIAKVESGRPDPRTGSITPWPWTIDANGTGYMYDSKQSAIEAASAFEAAGITSLDIGCLQVNLAQHPDAFQSLARAFDPTANADYAAGFLNGLEQKFGNWPQAVAAYHSQTQALGEPYAAKVYAAWRGAPDTAPMALSAVVDQGDAAPAMTDTIPPAFEMSALAAPMAILMPRGKTSGGRGLAAYRAAPVAIATRLIPRG